MKTLGRGIVVNSWMNLYYRNIVPAAAYAPNGANSGTELVSRLDVMTWWHRNAFRITGSLWGHSDDLWFLLKIRQALWKIWRLLRRVLTSNLALKSSEWVPPHHSLYIILQHWWIFMKRVASVPKVPAPFILKLKLKGTLVIQQMTTGCSIFPTFAIQSIILSSNL